MICRLVTLKVKINPEKLEGDPEDWDYHDVIDAHMDGVILDGEVVKVERLDG